MRPYRNVLVSILYSILLLVVVAAVLFAAYKTSCFNVWYLFSTFTKSSKKSERVCLLERIGIRLVLCG